MIGVHSHKAADAAHERPIVGRLLRHLEASHLIEASEVLNSCYEP